MLSPFVGVNSTLPVAGITTTAREQRALISSPYNYNEPLAGGRLRRLLPAKVLRGGTDRALHRKRRRDDKETWTL